MAKNEKTTKDAKKVAVETIEQQEITGSDQALSPAADVGNDTDAGSKSAPQNRYSVQAVAVPNNRRMRGGRVFTSEPETVSPDEFTPEQWRDILRDPHLKAIALDGQNGDAEA